MNGSEDEIGMAFYCHAGTPMKHWSVFDREMPSYSLNTVLPLKWIIREKRLMVMYGRAGKETVIGSADVGDLMVSDRDGDRHYDRLRTVLTEEEIQIEVNGIQVLTQKLPRIDRIYSVTEETEDAVLVKIVNVKNGVTPVWIDLDCETEDDYDVDWINGKWEDKNSFEQPEALHIRRTSYTKTGGAFFHECPPLSVSVLTLKKSKSDPRKP